MKKIVTVFAVLFIFVTAGFSQTNSTVDINDDVYEILRYSETMNLCSPLSYARPYSQSYILSKLNEIKENLIDQEKEYDLEILQTYIDRFDIKEGKDLKNATFKAVNKSEKFPFSFVLNDSIDTIFSSGLYFNNDINNYSYEFWDNVNFSGDIGHDISYKANAFLGMVYVPMNYLGDYDIGNWLYHKQNTATEPNNQPLRRVHVYQNNSYLPYSYNKKFDGSVYYFSDISASGLEGWPLVNSFAFGMTGEIHGSFCDNKIELGLGRETREWAAMDYNSSLVLNSNARPFIAFEASFEPFKWLSLSTLTGVLECPNVDYILGDAWYKTYDNTTTNTLTKVPSEYNDKDYYFFQNAFSMTMLGINLRYFHFDFGSTCVWPKRFELGYLFPLIDRVIYQNDIGDFDNLALFGNIKYAYPGFGSFWFSAYLDEVNAILKQRFWEKTRAMYAFQVGTKMVVPKLPFTTVSFRYTKIEPYCYTHHAIDYTPWYDHYINEGYSNNGECIGYYLPPNSDEINIQIETRPAEYLSLGLQYQLIRHGVDWGSQSTLGSNLYSELRNNDRDDLEKYFLRDGTYEWSNIVSLHCSYDLKKINLPVKVYASLGYIYDWFTAIDDDAYAKIKAENYDNAKNNEYHYISNDEYNDKNGFVITIGATIFGR